MDCTKKGMLIAASVAVLLAGGAIRAADSTAKASTPVHCGGVNACKGQGACSSKSNSCKGQNTCKGKGWLEMSSKAECKEKGGKVMKVKMMKPAA